MRGSWSGLVLVAVLLGSGCEECVDADGDGFGLSCVAGPDCDDGDPTRAEDCSAPPPDCEADPVAEGCPCLSTASSPCLAGETDGVGLCRAGLTRCSRGFWSACEGGVGPTRERCDGRDEDCDGRVDEGVLSPCGGCDATCVGGVWGDGPDPFEPTDRLAVTESGALTLALERRVTGTLWVANSAEATVSRVDVESAVETARYLSGDPEPSRVVVDWRGDAWVANRAFGTSSSVRKIAGALERCVDRDGDGLTTSTGPEDVLEDDECVLLDVPVGGPGAVARALAIDGDTGPDNGRGGDLWVGLHDAEAFLHVDGETGETLERIETPGFQPYAATFDRWGTLWSISRDGLLLEVSPRPGEASATTLREVPDACFLLYGLAADRAGRLLLSGFSCDRVFLYDPPADRRVARASEPSPRGVAVDDAGAFWIAHTQGAVSRAVLDPLRTADGAPLAGLAVAPFESIGVAVDAFGQVWVVSSQAAPGAPTGVATRFDPMANAVTAQVPLGAAPHVQGDLTGARTRFATVPSGAARRVFEGCGGEEATEWRRLHAEVQPGSRGRIRFRVRHAADRAGLDAADFVDVGDAPMAPPPYPVDLPDGGVVEVEVELSVEGSLGAPRLGRLGLEWRCPGPI